MSGPGFVLVHGGEHGPWCWDRVIPKLDWPSHAVSLPGREPAATRYRLRDSAEAVSDALAGCGFDPAIIVCHSLGGLAVLAAEPLHPVPPRHRVFVSALLPRPGTTGLDALPPLFRAFLRVRLSLATRRGARIHLLPRRLAMTMWCADLDTADTDLVLAHRCVEEAGIPLEPTPEHFTQAGASTYLVLDRDRAIRPRSQLTMATNLGIGDIRHLDAGHEVMLSHPNLLADHLNRIAHEIQHSTSGRRPT
jgi:pimeloyl-ACP methyl ester carboxylesterase